MANGERAGERATAALADEDHPLAAVVGELLQLLLQAGDMALGTADVDEHAAHSDAVATAPQPVAQHAERVIAGHEPGDQQHGCSVLAPAGVSQSAIAKQAQQLAAVAKLSPDGSHRCWLCASLGSRL